MSNLEFNKERQQKVEVQFNLYGDRVALCLSTKTPKGNSLHTTKPCPDSIRPNLLTLSNSIVADDDHQIHNQDLSDQSITLGHDNEGAIQATIQAVENYEADRTEHVELIDRLGCFLSDLKTGKRELLHSWLSMGSNYRSRDESSRRMKLVEEEQSLKKLTRARKLLKEIAPNEAVGSERSLARQSDSKFTKLPLPDWLPGGRDQPKSGIKKVEVSNAVKDLALKVERLKLPDDQGRNYRASWVPRRTKTELKSIRAARRLIQERSKPNRPFAPATPSPKPEPKPRQEAPVRIEPVEEEAKSAEETSDSETSSEIPQAIYASEEESESTKSPDASEICDPSSPVAEETVQPREEKMVQSAFAPVTFNLPVDAAREDARLVGGAAFGQTSMPRPQFGVGSMSGVTRGYSGDGFASFARQGNMLGATGQTTNGFSNAFQSFISQQGQTSFNGGGPQSMFAQSQFGAGLQQTSVFRSKPAKGNDKLWEMRK